MKPKDLRDDGDSALARLRRVLADPARLEHVAQELVQGNLARDAEERS